MILINAGIKQLTNCSLLHAITYNIICIMNCVCVTDKIIYTSTAAIREFVVIICNKFRIIFFVVVTPVRCCDCND